MAAEDPVHLAYHERNRARGRPIGQVTIRVEYAGQVGPWFDLLIATPEEVSLLAGQAGWRVEQILSQVEAFFTVVWVAG
jgi:hypothetical protein